MVSQTFALQRDQDFINNLYMSKKAYEEEKAVIENALKDSGARTGLTVTPEEIEQLQEDLFKMKHFGQSLKNIFYSIDRGNRVRHEQRKVVYDTQGWCSRALEFVPNPIKDLVVGGIKLVRVSRKGDYRVEKKRRTDQVKDEASALGRGVTLEEMDPADDVFRFKHKGERQS